MTGLTPLRVQREVTVSAGSGREVFYWPALSQLGRRWGHQGGVIGVKVRIESGSGWDFATVQCWLIDAHDSFVDPANPEADFDDYPEDVQVFRSDAAAVANPNGDDTDAEINEAFADLPVLFGSGLLGAVEWTTTGGAGTGTIIVTVEMEVAAP